MEDNMNDQVNNQEEVVEQVPEVTEEATLQEQPQDNSNSEENVEHRPENGFEKRLKRMQARLAESERELARLREREYAAKHNQPDTTIVKPKLEQFNNDIEAYTNALTEFKLAEVQRQREAERLAQQQVESVQRYNKLAEDYRKANPDFDDDMEEAMSIPIQPDLAEAIRESDVGPHVAHFLAKNPDTLAELNKMSYAKRLAEFGKIEDRIVRANKTKPVQSAQAKKVAPPTPVQNAGTSTAKKSYHEMTPAELIKARNAEKRR